MNENERESLPTLPPGHTPRSQSEPDAERRHRRRRRGFLAGIVLGGVVAGLVGVVIGATMPPAQAALHAVGRGKAPCHGEGGEPGEHAAFFVSFALHRLDATPDQEDRIQAIVASTFDELGPLIEEHRDNRRELRDLLTAAAVDRGALEALRKEELGLVGEISARASVALADSAEVLTPEQRLELAERLERFRH